MAWGMFEQWTETDDIDHVVSFGALTLPGNPT